MNKEIFILGYEADNLIKALEKDLDKDKLDNLDEHVKKVAKFTLHEILCSNVSYKFYIDFFDYDAYLTLYWSYREQGFLVRDFEIISREDDKKRIYISLE